MVSEEEGLRLGFDSLHTHEETLFSSCFLDKKRSRGIPHLLLLNLIWISVSLLQFHSFSPFLPRLKMSSSPRLGHAPFFVFISAVFCLCFLKAMMASPVSRGLKSECYRMSMGRILQEGNFSKQSGEVDYDTFRVDPLDNFKKYRGGFDITNKHYWASLIFTGISGYVVGILWLICGIMYAGFLLLIRKNGKWEAVKVHHCQKNCVLLPVLLATFLTALTIVGCGIAVVGSVKFHSRAKMVVEKIIDTADEASETIYNATGAMKDVQNNLQASNKGSAETSSFLNTTSIQLDSKAADIQRQAKKNRHLIQTGLRSVYVVTLVTVSSILAATLALSAAGFLKRQPILNWLIALCWMLLFLPWVFFGVYFFLGKFAGDCCTAFTSFNKNPYNNTLSSILPCDDIRSAAPVLSIVSAGIYNLVNQVNANISLFQTTAETDLPRICNPFSGPPDYRYLSGSCLAGTIPINDLQTTLKVLLTCSKNGSCAGGEFIRAGDLEMVVMYSRSVQGLVNVYPEMENLLQCEMVKDTFDEILALHCTPLKRYARLMWVSLLLLSAVMMMLVLLSAAGFLRERAAADPSVKPERPAENRLSP